MSSRRSQRVSMLSLASPAPSRSNKDASAYQSVVIPKRRRRNATGAGAGAPRIRCGEFGSGGFHVAGAGASVHDSINIPFQLREDVRDLTPLHGTADGSAGICAKRVPSSAALCSTHQERSVSSLRN